MAITVGVVMKVVTKAISTKMANISSFRTCTYVLKLNIRIKKVKYMLLAS